MYFLDKGEATGEEEADLAEFECEEVEPRECDSDDDRVRGDTGNGHRQVTGAIGVLVEGARRKDRPARMVNDAAIEVFRHSAGRCRGRVLQVHLERQIGHEATANGKQGNEESQKSHVDSDFTGSILMGQVAGERAEGQLAVP